MARRLTQEHIVLTIVTKDFDRPNSTPEDGSSEESVRAGAIETHGCVGSADILDVNLERKDTGAHKGRNKGSNHLRSERVPRGNLRKRISDKFLSRLCCGQGK